MSSAHDRSVNFIQAKVEADLSAGRYGGRVATRFPPEPNGYLHIGHAKSICLNFGLARTFGGTCNLRYDDTNPTTEDQEYADAILRDLRWLGFEPDHVFYASDYYEQLYQWAEKLIREGRAYVDDQSLEEIRASRGTVTEPGTPSPWRDRSVDENLRLFQEMRAGHHADGAKVLRARIDMAHPNMKMRDPLLYRIKREHHYRAGDAWCIYPMYDWAHGQSDAIERITHSICTLEFENNRELYTWFLETLGAETLGTDELPNQTEFARLDLTYTVMSKRKLLRLVKEGYVSGWDDPRMPTVAGMRRRGVTPEAIRAFAEEIGVARAMSKVDVGVLEHCIRDDLNRRAPRRMVVLDPLKVTLTNWPAGRVDVLSAPDFPADVGLSGERGVPFGGELWIERDDFAEVPPKGWRRLVPGGEVRLRYAYVMRCDEVVHDEAGRVVELRCSVDLDTLGANPSRPVKGTIHWAHQGSAVPCTVRLYDRLFSDPDPDGEGDFLAHLNPQSLVEVRAWAEPALASDAPGGRYQLERHAYAYRAPEDAAEGLIVNRIVGLKDSWAAATEAVASAAPDVTPEPSAEDARRASAEGQAQIKAAARAARLAASPALAARVATLVAAGVGEDDALRVAEDPARDALWSAAVATGAPASAVASTLLNAVAALAPEGPGGGRLDGAALGDVVGRVESGALSSAAARQVLGHLWAQGGSVGAALSALGLDRQVADEAVAAAAAAAVAAHPSEAARLAGGEEKLFGFFVGQVMRAARGARPEAVQAAVRAAIAAR